MDFPQIASGVFAALTGQSSNAGFMVGDDETLVVDTLQLPSLSRQLVSALEQRSAVTPRVVIDTHWHGDHVFGNMFFTTSLILAHKEVRRRMVETGKEMIARSIRMRPEFESEFSQVQLTFPTMIYEDQLTLYACGRRVVAWHPGPAHTDGDTLVHLPGEGVLFAGDLLFTRRFPAVLPEADTANWIKVLEDLETLGPAVIVPGHGPLSTVQDLRNLRAYLEHVLEAVRACVQKGMSKEETLAAVSFGPGEGWENSERHAQHVGQVWENLRKG